MKPQYVSWQISPETMALIEAGLTVRHLQCVIYSALPAITRNCFPVAIRIAMIPLTVESP